MVRVALGNIGRRSHPDARTGVADQDRDNTPGQRLINGVSTIGVRKDGTGSGGLRPNHNNRTTMVMFTKFHAEPFRKAA